MTETTLADAERALARATDLETEDAVAVLRTARRNSGTNETTPTSTMCDEKNSRLDSSSAFGR
ncbi:hypothetical protein [Natrinema caseinilyticum]|uniref:hypothetical protein n=1 Tax=Natrinema caseinilyticum TaxID=2961570 RepID=UPI003CCCE721